MLNKYCKKKYYQRRVIKKNQTMSKKQANENYKSALKMLHNKHFYEKIQIQTPEVEKVDYACYAYLESLKLGNQGSSEIIPRVKDDLNRTTSNVK